MNCRQVNPVTTLQSLELALERLAAHLESETALLTTSMEESRKAIARHDRILFGDNSVTAGLSARFQGVEELTADLRRLFYGDGTENNLGIIKIIDRIVERNKTADKASDDRKNTMRMVWGAIGTLAATVLAIVGKMLFHL